MSKIIDAYYSMVNPIKFTNLLNSNVLYCSLTLKCFFTVHEYDFIFVISEEFISTIIIDKENEFSNFNISLTSKSLKGYDRMVSKSEDIDKSSAQKYVFHGILFINNLLCAQQRWPQCSLPIGTNL